MRALLIRTCLLGALATAVACGSVKVKDDAGPPEDADPSGGDDADGVVVPTDDSNRAEVITGGGRMQGANYRMDVTIGHPTSQQETGGGGKTLEGATPIKP